MAIIMSAEQIKEVLEMMGFRVKCTPKSTTFSRGKFTWTADRPLDKVDLHLLIIYYGDHQVMSRSGGQTNGWN